jgi:hypothetical protein
MASGGPSLAHKGDRSAFSELGAGGSAFGALGETELVIKLAWVYLT